jgi:hypothetical protein
MGADAIPKQNVGEAEPSEEVLKDNKGDLSSSDSKGDDICQERNGMDKSCKHGRLIILKFLFGIGQQHFEGLFSGSGLRPS